MYPAIFLITISVAHVNAIVPTHNSGKGLRPWLQSKFIMCFHVYLNKNTVLYRNKSFIVEQWLKRSFIVSKKGANVMFRLVLPKVVGYCHPAIILTFQLHLVSQHYPTDHFSDSPLVDKMRTCRFSYIISLI